MKETRRVSPRISGLMLERYRLREVSAEERGLVEAELAADAELHLRYERLEDSDRELHRLYPFEQSPLKDLSAQTGSRPITRGRFPSGRLIPALCAAAALLCVLFPSVYYLRGMTPARQGGIAGLPEGSGDRAKGIELKAELSIYLKENPFAIPADEGRRLPDKTLLKEGNTVQLAYTIPPGALYYGVIFSIDGRAEVTMHYPYRKGQSPVLAAGKRTFLDEAYTLDDAPEMEIFFMVVSQDPLDTEHVLETAREIARGLAHDPGVTLEKSAAAFSPWEVETITIRK